MAQVYGKLQLRQRKTSPLIQEAMQAAATVRHICNVDPFAPISVYDLCEHMGVTVRFAAVNMEGMYDRTPVPRIHLSSLRPMGRRAFTCAHELAHHYFKHGTTVDRLIKADDPSGPRNEALANLFAASLLMPAAGLRQALSARAIEPSALTAPQAFALSTRFGVGYGTLLRQLHSGLGFLSEEQFRSLSRQPPWRITQQVLGSRLVGATLKLVDTQWGNGTVDVEKGDLLLCPTGTIADGSLLAGRTDTRFPCFECTTVGLARLHLPFQDSSVFVRVQERHYVGLAKFRHLEAED